MAKKPSCRRTKEENEYHDKAVKLRKMTDAQLCNYVKDQMDEFYNLGYQKGKEESENQSYTDKSGNVQKFLNIVLESKIKGIGIVTVNKLMKVAAENGFIQ